MLFSNFVQSVAGLYRGNVFPKISGCAFIAYPSNLLIILQNLVRRVCVDKFFRIVRVFDTQEEIVRIVRILHDYRRAFNFFAFSA